MLDRLQSLVDRYEQLTAEMGRPELTADYERLQTLAKERASLEDIVSLYRRYRETERRDQRRRAPSSTRRAIPRWSRSPERSSRSSPSAATS